LKNVQKLCPYFLQVPPSCIKWLVDDHASKIFSHVFAIKGSPKTGDVKWIEEDFWLREHHEEYDALYQQTGMEEEEHVEHAYREQQRKEDPRTTLKNEVHHVRSAVLGGKFLAGEYKHQPVRCASL
jgi:hypothetical protein